MAESEEFVVVKGKRRGRIKAKSEVKPSVSHQPMLNENDDHIQVDLLSMNERINSCKQEILQSDFFSKNFESILTCLKQMCGGMNKNDRETGCTEPQENISDTEVDLKKLDILSFGIGNFTSCPIARYQLAFLLALKDKLRCLYCEVFDPVFTIHEKILLASQNCQVLPHNEEGKRLCHTYMIVFMPHCGKALYNNFLWKNAATADSASLFNFLLIGNSFANMLERTPTSILRKTASYVIKLQPHVNETKVENSFIHKDIFNDLSLMWFPKSRLEAIQSSLGDCEEPVYLDSDVEMIRS